MSVNWNWKDKIGSIEWEETHSEMTVNVYRGNCLCVLLYEYTDENNIEKYCFAGFFNDSEHLKICIGLKKDCDGKYHNMYKDIWKKWKLNTFYKESMQIAPILTKAGFKVELYYEEIKK